MANSQQFSEFSCCQYLHSFTHSLVHSLQRFVHSFIPNISIASSSPLLRGTPGSSFRNVSDLTRRSATITGSEGLAQGPIVADRVGFEPETLRTHDT